MWFSAKISNLNFASTTVSIISPHNFYSVHSFSIPTSFWLLVSLVLFASGSHVWRHMLFCVFHRPICYWWRNRFGILLEFFPIHLYYLSDIFELSAGYNVFNCVDVSEAFLLRVFVILCKRTCFFYVSIFLILLWWKCSNKSTCFLLFAQFSHPHRSKFSGMQRCKMILEFKVTLLYFRWSWGLLLLCFLSYFFVWCLCCHVN